MVRSSKGYAPNTKPWKKAIPEFQTITPNHEVASGWSGWRLLPSLHLVRSFDSGFICDSAPRNTNRWFHWICGPTPSRYPSWNVSGMVKKGQTGAGEFSGQIRWKRRKWVLTWKDLCLICISMLDLDKFPLCISIYLCLSFYDCMHILHEVLSIPRPPFCFQFLWHAVIRTLNRIDCSQSCTMTSW